MGCAREDFHGSHSKQSTALLTHLFFFIIVNKKLDPWTDPAAGEILMSMVRSDTRAV